MSKLAVNTFKEGLVMDLNPLANDNKSLTNALNATFITLNGNELMLQNDMGNGRINRVRLDDGYIPVGIKEYGGIIYIASYNPKNGKGLVGSFPYPKLEWEGQDFSNTDIPLNSIYGNTQIKAHAISEEVCDLDFYEIKDDSEKIPLLIDSQGNQLKIHSGDSFSVKFEDDTILFLKSPNINIKLVVKTSSNYYTVSEDKEAILSEQKFVYGGSYSGYVYLLIDLIIYNDFEIDYIIQNNEQVILYPRAFNSDYSNLEVSNNIVVLPEPENKSNRASNIANINCNYVNESLSIGEGTYYIYPITKDGGYISNLRRKLNINLSNLECGLYVSQFKYMFNDNNIIQILSEYQSTSDSYSLFGNISYVYRFYPIDSIKDSVSNLNNLYKTNNYTVEVVKSNYTTKSGIRYVETELPRNEIYLLVVSCRLNTLEEVLFTRFIYGTSRYNSFYDVLDDYNLINPDIQKISYSIGSNIFNPELLSIKHYHLYGEDWVESLNLVKYSELPIQEEEIPDAFKSSIEIKLNKTTDSIIECIPDSLYEYIYDKDVFTLQNNDIEVTITNSKDTPKKSSNDILLTDYNNNQIQPVSIENDSFKFYRYISSRGSDGVALQDRTIKTLAPVFDPENINKEELFGFSLSSNYMDSVICSKKFLSDSCSRLLNPLIRGNVTGISLNDQGFYSFLSGEESLTSGSVKLSNLLSAILSHSSITGDSSTMSIFDIFAGGNSKNNDDDSWYDVSDLASLEIRRTLNNEDLAGIDSPNHNKKQINGTDDFMIATCLNVKGKPIPINLASRCISKIFDSGTFVGDYVNSNGNIESVTRSNEADYPKITGQGLKEYYSYINVGKKLQCLLSLIFTVLKLNKEIYFVGPSISSLNYNILDESYIEYTCKIQNSTGSTFKFTSEIDYTLNKISQQLLSYNNCDDNTYAKNYIGSVESDTITNTYNYGHLVNMDSSLFGHILSLYLDAYDNNELLDESGIYSDEEIYYLSSKNLTNTYRVSDISQDNNEVWSNSGIYFNGEYHCFTYDLGKLNTSSLIVKSELSLESNWLFDWNISQWQLEPLAKNFVTVNKAQKEYSNIISDLSNNFILLNKITTDIKTLWVWSGNTAGPGIAYIDFGKRGLCKSKHDNFAIIDNYYGNNNVALQNRIADIINKYEFSELKERGYFSDSSNN